MRLYLDANGIIYGIEGIAPFHERVLRRILEAGRTPEGVLITSRLSRLECRTKPLRDRNVGLLTKYDEFFARPRLAIVDVSAEVIERATELRARYGFKTPDSIHMASALLASADVFLTGDAQLVRCTELTVEVLKSSDGAS